MSAARTARAGWRVTRSLLVALRSGRLPAGVGAVLAGVLLSVLVTDAHFAVRRVAVEGVVALPGPSLAETSGVLGRGVFGVDARAVAERLAALPAVRRVAVHTEFPDLLVIRVTERQVVVVWETGAGSLLLDRDGTVLARADMPPPNVPRVRVLAPGAAGATGATGAIAVGERVEPRLVGTALAVIDRLPAEAGVTEAAVVVDPTIGVIVQTARWNAVVGTDERLGQKLAMLRTLARDDQTWTEVDLRDPTRVALLNAAAMPAMRAATPVASGTTNATEPTGVIAATRGPTATAAPPTAAPPTPVAPRR